MSTLATFDAFLKNNYGNRERVQKLMYTGNPFLAYITKKGGQGGKKLIAPVQYASGQAISSSFATSQSIAGSSGGSLKGLDWVVDWGDYFANLEIDTKLLMLSKGNDTSYLEARKAEVDALYEQFAFNLSGYLLRGKSRNIGSFTESSGVCALTNPDDIVQYQPGMQLQASAGDGSSTGHSLLGSGSIGYIIKVNAVAGTFTVSATDGGSAGTPSGWTGTMYAFRNGDFGGGATPNRVVDGFDDWCPTADPSATPFNNIDRTIHVGALSGFRLTAAEMAGKSTEDRIKRLVTRMSGRGYGAPDAVFLNPEKWQDVADGLESRGIREIGKDATFGFRSFQVASGGGTVEVFSDRSVPINTIAALSKGAIELNYPQASIGEPETSDGMQMLRKASSNAIELRIALYPATIGIPGKLGRAVAA